MNFSPNKAQIRIKMSSIRNTGQDCVAKMLRMMQKMRLPAVKVRISTVVLRGRVAKAVLAKFVAKMALPLKRLLCRLLVGVFAALCCLLILH